MIEKILDYIFVILVVLIVGMVILNRAWGKTKRLDPNSVSLKMRDTLFGDMPLDFCGTKPEAGFPWDQFALVRASLAAGNKNEAIAALNKIVSASNLESRMRLQAWHYLREQGQAPPPEIAKQVFGVVVEVPMRGGLDLLAAYSDHTARFWSHANAGVVWEHPDISLDPLIDRLLEASKSVVAQIGPWQKDRPAAPAGDTVRLSILTPSGLHFGQGPAKVFFADPLAAPTLEAASELMAALTQKGMATRKLA